jgi:hypothetical protein
MHFISSTSEFCTSVVRFFDFVKNRHPGYSAKKLGIKEPATSGYFQRIRVPKKSAGSGHFKPPQRIGFFNERTGNYFPKLFFLKIN